MNNQKQKKEIEWLKIEWDDMFGANNLSGILFERFFMLIEA